MACLFLKCNCYGITWGSYMSLIVYLSAQRKYSHSTANTYIIYPIVLELVDVHMQILLSTVTPSELRHLTLQGIHTLQ